MCLQYCRSLIFMNIYVKVHTYSSSFQDNSSSAPQKRLDQKFLSYLSSASVTLMKLCCQNGRFRHKRWLSRFKTFYRDPLRLLLHCLVMFRTESHKMASSTLKRLQHLVKIQTISNTGFVIV